MKKEPEVPPTALSSSVKPGLPLKSGGPSFSAKEYPPLLQGSVATFTPHTLEAPPELPGNIEIVTYKDKSRRLLALLLWGTLAGTIILGFALLAGAKWLGVDAKNVLSLIQIFFTALVTLVGSATGFYFGSEVKRSGDQQNN